MLPYMLLDISLIQLFALPFFESLNNIRDNEWVTAIGGFKVWSMSPNEITLG